MCGCDGLDYPSACHAQAAQVSVDFNFPCDTVFCSPWIGLDCTLPDEICDVWGCATDLNGICILQPTSCPDVCVPVCGCDGQAYASHCHRQEAAVALFQEGDCDEVRGASFDTRDQLSWNAPFNATGYNVYREVVADGPAAGAWSCFLADVGTSSVPITDQVASGELWLLQVAAIFGSGEGSLGFETAGCTNRIPISACPP